MTITDWVGFVGVTILLIAFFLNLMDIIKTDSFWYLFLNVVGASIACLASVLLKFIPFIILEVFLTLVSAVRLFKYFKRTLISVTKKN